jgi:hypothetical protein
VWKLFGPGSVGSQTMLGIPKVWTLRDDPLLRDASRVWPFETGFTYPPIPSIDPFVLHAEIWPGIVNERLDPSVSIRDQAQVRAMVEWLHDLDTTNQLTQLFDAPSSLSDASLAQCTEHEGWIFGTGWLPTV